MKRGFTLVEMMVVLAIISIMCALAYFYLRADPLPIDMATRVGDLARESSRRAIALGPVRPDVALALGSKARTRIRAFGAPQPTFVLERFQEDALPAATGTWIEVQRFTIDDHVIGESWAVGVGSHATLPLNVNWAAFVVQCYPNGTCDPRSLFFQMVRPGTPDETFARVSIMPIGGAILLREDWN
jgi:prepilin-type N-terminal cleavage/methylation domain-containing protein